MDFGSKASHRKSRAPWQSAAPNSTAANPYANANTSLVSNDGPTNVGSNGRSKNHQHQQSQQGLKVPNPYAASNTKSRKNNRRLSIHASAMAHGKSGGASYDLQSLPPVPNLYGAAAQSSDQILITQSIKEERDEFAGIEDKIVNQLSYGSAAEIDDYYKVLNKQKLIVTRDIKANINQNQKNILELTNDLQSTQDELLKLRISTKGLYEVIKEFKEGAERRLALEHEVPSQSNDNTKNGSSGSGSGRLLNLPNKRKDRSSVLVLEKMWANELQSLFKHVEGASKFIQAIPGRHVIAESGRWHEVNVGTWKETKTIHIFILNDLLLVAAKKPLTGQEGIGASNRRIQAIHCWPLLEVKISEIKPPSSSLVGSNNPVKDDSKSYAINVQSKTLSYVYRTDRYDHFLKIMEAYNKGSNELLQKNRLLDARTSTSGLGDISETNDEKRQLRESLRGSGIMEQSNVDDSIAGNRKSGSNRQSTDILLQDISARVHSRNRSHDFGKAYSPNTTSGQKIQRFNSLKVIEDKLDEVDVHIAHNKYYESVGLVNYIEGKLLSIEKEVSDDKSKDDEIDLLLDVIKLKIDSRKVKLQQYLNFDLQHNISKLSNGEISQIIEFFQNFNQLDKGISSYLQAMSTHLSNAVAKLVVGVQGSTRIDIVNYLSNLVIIYISIIKRAISVYKECITPIIRRMQKLDVDSSGFISWCIDEVSKLVVSIKKHLYGTLITVSNDPETDLKVYKIKDKKFFSEFLNVIKPQLNDLKTVGVNVDFLFDDILSLQD